MKSTGRRQGVYYPPCPPPDCLAGLSAFHHLKIKNSCPAFSPRTTSAVVSSGLLGGHLHPRTRVPRASWIPICSFNLTGPSLNSPCIKLLSNILSASIDIPAEEGRRGSVCFTERQMELSDLLCQRKSMLKVMRAFNPGTPEAGAGEGLRV